MKRREFLYTLGGGALSLLAGGCAGNMSRGPQIAAEPLPGLNKARLSRKYLHTRSFQQQLMLLYAQRKKRAVFLPDSDDFYVNWSLPQSPVEELIRARGIPGISIRLVRSSGRELVYRVKDGRPSPYTELAHSQISLQTLRGNKFSGKYIVSMDFAARSIVSQIPGDPDEVLPASYILDKLYGVAKSEGKELFFGFDEKARILRISSEPEWIGLTPYKRQFFVNYLKTSGIDYGANEQNEVCVRDNFSNWARAMNTLRELNKYSHMVYGVYDGAHYFESADSNYRSQPITIEMIDWTPGGAREYNIYSGGYHRKLTTRERFFTYYVPDGSAKYLIRFY
jgi:hypothetical protein